jgi:N-succinyldiaminopimelate aminotransferase
MPRTPHLSARLQGFGTTIFAEMSQRAAAVDAVNLGQGFPDEDGPAEVLEAAVAAIRSGRNQYPPGPGAPELLQAVAGHQDRFWGLQVDPDCEVLVTAGATEALAAAMLGLLDVGDEVVVFQPMYDSYAACIAMAGAVARPVTLRAPTFGFEAAELRAAITDRTRMIVLNTPHNPSGTMIVGDQLQLVADLAIAHDLVVVSDEVYEHLTFDGHRHVPIATLPGMAQRTLTVSSGGKTFRTTGWKVGWVTGPEALVRAVRTAKQFLTFVSSGPFQPAIALGLSLPDSYFHGVARDLSEKRDHLVEGLRGLGLQVTSPSATYFVTVDIRPLAPDGDGLAFCRALPERCGVAAVPAVAFYDPTHADEGRHLVRFAFCKRHEVLDEAITRLAKL